MTFTSDIEIGWKRLKTILENFRKAINQNQPLRGDGIMINPTEGGCIISLEKKQDGGSKDVPDQKQTFGVQAVTVFDANGNAVTLNVMTDGKAPVSDPQIIWQSTGVIDPVSCQQTQMQVLIYKNT